MMDSISSLVHIKLKYHNVHDGKVTINDYLSKANNIYQLLQKDQKEGEAKAMKINVTSLIRKLKNMDIRPLPRKCLSS